jgi:hypothetical protein
VFHCEWWQDGRNVRYSTHSGENPKPGESPTLLHQEREGLVTEGGVKSTLTDVHGSGKSEQRTTMGTLDDPTFVPEFRNPWGMGLFYCFNQANNYYDKMFTERRSECRDLVVTTDHGLPMVAFTDSHGTRFESSFDPSVNYLVRRRCMYWAGQDKHKRERLYEDEVKEFMEVAPGVYFPVHIETRRYRNGKLCMAGDSKIDVLMVNGAVPGDKLQLDFPVGARVLDHKDQVAYTVGPNGERVKVRPLGSVLYGRGQPPAGAWRWYLGMGLAAAGIAVLGYVCWRRLAVARAGG